ncbi:MAG: cohesin domain-containing protein [Saprospiraceae bacterium]
MHKLLIPLIFCLTATIANAQVPTLIKLGTAKPNALPSPDGACSAGTFTFGPILGQSNDNTPDTLFLCQGDSMCVQHNGDAMFMDPDPSTPAGIAYAFYKCPPYSDGDEMAVLADSCLWPGASNGFFATQGPADGSHCFFNSGSITMSSIFGQNGPVAVTFAPITITDYANGLLEPGCVDVGINEAFTIVYLKPIEIISINTSFTDDCKGKFRLQGGYPEWDKNTTYTVSIFLSTDPSVRALIYTPPSQIKDGLDVIFSVPKPGVYTIVVEDGKSCGVTVQVNMNGCIPTDNVTIALPELTVPPDSSICVPVTVINFQNILGSSFSLTWDPTVLRYDSITNPNPAIGGNAFGAANGNLNENEALNGFLGVVYSDFAGTTNVADDSVLFEVCFTAIAPLDSCTTLDVGSFPSTVTMDDAFGNELAVTVDTGNVCINFFPLEITTFINKVNCDNTAQLAVAITGGQGPWEVIWRTCTGIIGGISVSNVADTIFTLPVAEGCWEICVTDQNGLGTQICQTLNVNIPSLGATMTVVQLPTCNGASNGSVRADVTVDGVLIPNPGANFTYEWNTVPMQTMQTISGLPQGNYSVTVKDNSTGCTQVASGSLSQPPAITVNPTVTPASCPGIADGSITLTAAGGTPGPAGNQYLFLWEYSPDCQPANFSPDDSGSGNPFVATGKPAGCYCVTVTDANGCTLTDCVQITNARDVRIDTILVSDPSCFGLSDGSIQAQILANPAFVNPNFLFFWNPTPPGSSAQNVNNRTTYINLPAGMYDLVALDLTSGCQAQAKFTLVDPPVLDLALVSKTNPTCLLQTDGAISVSASGGTPNYTYAWSSVPTTTVPGVPNPTNLGPANYSVTVTDGNGCRDSLAVPLPLPPPPAITSFDSTSVVCGSDGSLRVNAPTGVSYVWTTINDLPLGATPQINNLSGGGYIVTVFDAQNCSTKDTVFLATKPPLVLADSMLTRPTCFGGSDGSIALTIQGGNPGYTYNWLPGNENTFVIVNKPAGTYTVTVRDSRGCTLVKTFVLTNPPAMVVTKTGIAPATCPGVCDGRATIGVTYSGTLANFNFLWTGGSTDSSRTDLCPGMNYVTVTDPVLGCFVIDSVLIGAPPAFNAVFKNDSVSCFGLSDGRSQATITGGNGQPYNYLWSSGSMTSIASGVKAGPITLTVTDNKGCTQVFSTQIEEPTQIIATKDPLNSKNPLCFGESNGELGVIVTGGTPSYTFAWANAFGPLTDTGNPITDLAAGTYSVTVTDNKGCSAVQTGIILSDPAPVQGVYMPWEPIPCFGEETTLFIDSITGGAGAPYQYSLDNGVYLDPGFPISMGGGEHYITYIDRQGCERTDTIFVDEPAPFTVKFDPNEVELELGDSLQLIPIISGSTVVDFDWVPPTALSNPDTLEPFTRTYESEKYTIVVFDANGCSATASIQVNIDPNRNVYIPNAFVPGANASLNDHFNPNIGRGVEIVNYMRIFDRWGNLMYEREKFLPNNNDFAEGWDGRYRGQFVNPGVYVYLVEVRFLDGRTLLYRGDVTVVR